MSNENWFIDWFNTPYYHSLYKNRDEAEAKSFIEALVTFLKLAPNTKVLDLACGKGRHSITLHQLGMQVTGVDLSTESIKAAKEFEDKTLNFSVHDMRLPLNEKYQVVFNLFTSFGYFDTQNENDMVIKSMYQSLDKDGILVIDFMNAFHVIENMVAKEVKEVDGISFHISRRFDGQHIFKDIQFTDNGQAFSFTERVQALQLEDFTKLLTQNNFKILHTFGNFKLAAFDKNVADRLIIIAQK
jgi:SAM-dependent methyltransferase